MKREGNRRAVRIGAQFVRELTDGEDWSPHPSGNGIVITHPTRKPLWCRREGGAYRQDLLDLAGTTHFCPDWDDMLIDETMPEFECCACGKKSTAS